MPANGLFNAVHKALKKLTDDLASKRGDYYQFKIDEIEAERKSLYNIKSNAESRSS